MRNLGVFFTIWIWVVALGGCQLLGNTAVKEAKGAYIFSAQDGRKVRVTPYGNAMIRIQSIRANETFFPDNHYEMVEHHTWPRQLQMSEDEHAWRLHNPSHNLVAITINKQTLAATFIQNDHPVLTEASPVSWHGYQISTHFRFDSKEHFTGLGHSYYGRAQSLDLRGQIVERNYGDKQTEQAPLIVPFYLSSKGYGIFLNSTFQNRFNFGSQNEYSFAINDSGFGGRMDYFFIGGPSLRDVLNHYTQLTGRPRLPAMAMFGLQLSDKSHDHNSVTPSDENWWKTKILAHRTAGFPLDHVVNDNRWRAAGGQRCLSKLAWDRQRYPDPKAYAEWLKKQGLVATLDFNRCIAQFSTGWKPEFNIPSAAFIDFKESAPDLTNPEFRAWFWQVFYRETLDPILGFPNDALWIDEFDEMGAAPKNMILANGRSSAEMRNYWFFLIAKALVQEGWDKSDLNKRPFVWVRGMTAGAQRYATLWSGDIQPNYSDMATQVRAMQLAGLSGFPYWGHDAGGFYDWENEEGPDDRLYIQWAMAFGSFAPIWKPHGMGLSRWPLDRSPAAQNAAHKFGQLRYELMPYLYSAAHQAAYSGLPIARPMLLDFSHHPKAWQYDLQYLWGDSLLIAPNTGLSDLKKLWLPPGRWFDYETKQVLLGDQILNVMAPTGKLPMYVKAGAIIPKRDFVPSAAFINPQKLRLDIYAGGDGALNLIEDDGITEEYRTKNFTMTTDIRFNEKEGTLTISKARGTYLSAPQTRHYQLSLYGFNKATQVQVNGIAMPIVKNVRGGLQLDIPARDVTRELVIEFAHHRQQ